MDSRVGFGEMRSKSGPHWIRAPVARSVDKKVPISGEEAEG